MTTFADALEKLDDVLQVAQNADTFESMELDSDSVSDFHYLARRCEDFLERYRQLMGDNEELHI